MYVYIYSHLSYIVVTLSLYVDIFIKVMDPGGVTVCRWPLVCSVCLPSSVRGDVRMRGRTFVDIFCLTVAVKRQNKNRIFFRYRKI